MIQRCLQVIVTLACTQCSIAAADDPFYIVAASDSIQKYDLDGNYLGDLVAAAGDLASASQMALSPDGTRLFVGTFQAAGGSLVMLAKGNRSAQVTEACEAHGGFYLGSIGGPAARLAKDCITKVEVLEYPELGMEAVWRIEVVDFPAFIVVDDKGNDFFRDI